MIRAGWPEHQGQRLCGSASRQTSGQHQRAHGDRPVTRRPAEPMIIAVVPPGDLGVAMLAVGRWTVPGADVRPAPGAVLWWSTPPVRD